LKEQAALLELAQDAIFVRDFKANGIIFWNGGAAELYGWKAVEACGHSSHELFNTVFPQPLAAIEAELDQNGKWAGELIHTRSDGSIITVASRWALQRDDRGEPVAVMEINRDITLQKSAAAALHNVHNRLNLALGGGRIGTWEWDVRGDVLSCDDRLAALFGLTSGARIADLDYFASLVHSDDRGHVRAQLARGLETGSFDAEFRVPWPDGSVRVIVSHGETSSEAGNAVKLTGVSWDVTERKSFEAELQSRAAEMERFTYTVSHDLKSPVITIKSYVAMIDQDLAAGNLDRARSDLQRVVKAADKMNQLLEELLALSRVGRVENKPEKVAFASLVGEALELVAGGIKNRHVRVEVARDLPSVTVDRRRMVEVLQNLIDNASKFMGNQTEPEIRIGASNDGMETRFFVKDNGVGVEPRHHDRIFGLFDKLDPKSGGSGAGLAIVKRIVETHEGRIWVESLGNGGGSTFWFTLNEGEQ
jgi:PAS domain S-box-containing protein